jgi:hypothetical protein
MATKEKRPSWWTDKPAREEAETALMDVEIMAMELRRELRIAAMMEELGPRPGDADLDVDTAEGPYLWRIKDLEESVGKLRAALRPKARTKRVLKEAGLD